MKIRVIVKLCHSYEPCKEVPLRISKKKKLKKNKRVLFNYTIANMTRNTVYSGTNLWFKQVVHNH